MKSLAHFGIALGFWLVFACLSHGQVPAGEPVADNKPAPETPLTETVLFAAGQDGYHTFRIPALITTPKGTVLAFCEGRKTGTGDSGDIDLLLKRTTDGGRTWGNLTVVWDDGANTCGNPCPVIDQTTGVVWLLLTHNLGRDKESQILAGTSAGSRTVWVSRSADDGLTWTPPKEIITAATKQPDWTWYATGPGIGIQLRDGRLVVPCDHNLAGTRQAYSHVIYSDDHGETWRLGGSTGPGCNECQVVQLNDGSLLLNMRSYRRQNRRLVATSTDSGLSFSEPREDPALIEPVCQASLLSYPSPSQGSPALLLFSNPASLKREKMTVRLSLDQGRTWPIAKELHSGPSAYSCLAVLPDRGLGCLYERGTTSPYQTITFARFTLDWLRSASR